MYKRVVGKCAHPPDKFGDQGTRQSLRKGELQLIACVDHTINDYSILSDAVARSNCGEGFTLHDKITI